MRKNVKNLLTALLLAASGQAGLAAENTATGTVGGIPGTLTPSGLIKLDVVALELRKELRDMNGIILGSAANVPQGAMVWFVIYVHNLTATTLADLQLQDAVPAGAGNFTVQPLGANVHAEALDLGGVVPGEESKTIGENWNAAWQPVSDAGGDNANAANSGEYDANTQTFTFGTAATPAEIQPNLLRAYRIKVIVN